MTVFSMPPGTSLERTKAMTQKVSKTLADFDGMYVNAIVNGGNLLSGTVSPSYAASYSILKQPKDSGKIKDINLIMDSIRHVFDALLEGNSFTFSMPTVPGFGNVDALDVMLKDNTGGAIDKL